MKLPPLANKCVFFWLVSMLLALPASAQNISAKPIVKNAFVDLRTANLSTSISLAGEWKFYWNKLLTPQQALLTAPDTLLYFPQRFDETFLHGVQLPSIGFATYSATIVLPKHTQPLSILLPDSYTNSKLYINDSLVGETGTVGTTEKTSVPFWRKKVIPLPALDTLQLTLQISNFYHSKGGPAKNLEIGHSSFLLQSMEFELAFDFLVVGLFLMGAIFFFSLYFFGSADKATLYFALFCLAYAYRVVGSDSYFLHQITNTSWFITTRLEYLSLYVSVGFLTLYIKNLFPEDTPEKLVQLALFVLLAFSTITLIAEPFVYTEMLNFTLLIIIGIVFMSLYVFFKAFIKRRTGSIYALLSICLMAMVFFMLVFSYFGYAKIHPSAMSVGYMVFIALQSLILSFRFSHQLKTAQRQAEQGLSAKSEFLSTMSHEIRTPLNSVIGLTHILLKNNPRTDQKEDLDVLLFSANNLLGIVNDILDYNKIEAGKLYFEKIDIDIPGIAKNIVGGMRVVANEKALDIQLIVDLALNHYVLGDSIRLAQVLTNLLHNAVKFTAQGHVLLKISVMEKSKTHTSLQFKVEDTGIGIPKEKQEYIFDRFTQADSSTSRSYGGTGLGLAICKRIIEAWGGVLTLRSQVGVGTTFFFTIDFPTVDRKLDTNHVLLNDINKPKQSFTGLAGVQVLLVEDNPINVMVAKNFLDEWGAVTEVAENGAEAVEKIDAQKHQLVLMDMHMPIMDGYEATKIIRSRGITIPIIALTANVPEDVAKELAESGMSGIVVKPFIPDVLYTTMVEFINHTKPNSRNV
ncbi:MAG: response regulator [Bacteroidetes bacterium]|nr:MAG: response regulator [Bacteroidota bacterium]TAF93610.1 MAG: response regulator [Bacteroidota bacterium]